MYASIRQGKAKAGMAEELTRRIKEGAIPIISDVEGFMAYYVVYAPDDTVTAISIFKDYAGAEELNKRALCYQPPHRRPQLSHSALLMRFFTTAEFRPFVCTTMITCVPRKCLEDRATPRNLFADKNL